MSDQLDLDEGPSALPRANGELVFTEPWQSRLFATTMTLRERGALDWERFRQGLIAQIAAHEPDVADGETYDYWGCWQRALEELLAQLGVVPSDRLAAASQQLANRPPDH